jgi:hypothetical protein
MSGERGLVLTLLATVVGIIGCSDDPCERSDIPLSPPEPMFSVAVTYASTGQPAWWGAQAFAIDGMYVDTLQSLIIADSTDSNWFSTYRYREGTYRIRVERAGYVTWESDSIRVETDECGDYPSFDVEAALEAE